MWQKLVLSICSQLGFIQKNNQCCDHAACDVLLFKVAGREFSCPQLMALGQGKDNQKQKPSKVETHCDLYCFPKMISS